MILPNNQTNPRLFDNILTWEDVRDGPSQVYVANLSFVLTDVQSSPRVQDPSLSVTLNARLVNVRSTRTVWAEVFGPGGAPVLNASMPSVGSGSYALSRLYSQVGTYRFVVYAEDDLGQVVSAAGAFDIRDVRGPTIAWTQATPYSPGSRTWVNVTAAISDGSGVRAAYLEVSAPDGNRTNETMTGGPSGIYSLNRTYDAVGTCYYRVSAVDTVGNWARAEGTFSIVDRDPPTIADAKATPDVQDVGGYVNLTATVTDDVAVGSVAAVIRFPDGTYRTPGLARATGDLFYDNASYSMPGSYDVTVWAKDTSGHLTEVPLRFVVRNRIAPTTLDVQIDGSNVATYPLSARPPQVTLTAVVSGRSVIAGANYTYGARNWPGTAIPLPADLVWDESTEDVRVTLDTAGAAGTHAYCVYSWDIDGNRDVAGACATLVIVDDLPPRATVGPTLSPSPSDVSDSDVNLTATFSDSGSGDTAITNAEWYLSNGTAPAIANGAGRPLSASDGAFDSPVEGAAARLRIQGWPKGTYDLWAHAVDASGNWGLWAPVTLTIIDARPPRIVAGPILVPATAGTSVTSSRLSATFSDVGLGDSLIAAAEWFLSNGTAPSIANGTGHPMTPASPPFDSPVEEAQADLSIGSWPKGMYLLWVHASDASGNWGAWVSVSLSIVDDQGPVISIGPEATPSIVGTSSGVFALDATASDVGLGDTAIAEAEWWASNGTPPSIQAGGGNPMSPSLPPFDSVTEPIRATIRVGSWPTGGCELWVHARDAAGNWGPWVGVIVSLVDDQGPATPLGVDVLPSRLPVSATPVLLMATVSDAGLGSSEIFGAEWYLSNGTAPSIANGTGHPMSAKDGRFDSVSEDLIAEVDTAAWRTGTYDLWVHGRDSAGNWGPWTMARLVVFEAGPPPPPPPPPAEEVPAALYLMGGTAAGVAVLLAMFYLRYDLRSRRRQDSPTREEQALAEETEPEAARKP